MFIIEGRATATGGQVFYSRRSNGPYYRWWYEHELQQWRFARVHTEEVPSIILCAFSWKDVPLALQGKLVEHYVE